MNAINPVLIKPSFSHAKVVCNICALPCSPLCTQFVFDQYAIRGLGPEGEPVLFGSLGSSRAGHECFVLACGCQHD